MVISSHVKITCYFHMWRYQVFGRKMTWYFIGVYIINTCTFSKCTLPWYIFLWHNSALGYSYIRAYKKSCTLNNKTLWWIKISRENGCVPGVQVHFSFQESTTWGNENAGSFFLFIDCRWWHDPSACVFRLKQVLNLLYLKLFFLPLLFIQQMRYLC